MLCLAVSVLAVKFNHGRCGASEHHACETKQTPCTGLRSNRGNRTGPVLPAEGMKHSDEFVGWVREYASAFESRNLTALRSLRAAGGVWDWKLFPRTDVAFGTFLNFKSRILDALVIRARLDNLWTPGASLLDVGAGTGTLSAYLAARHGMLVTAYEIPFTGMCNQLLASPFCVNFFWKQLPTPPCSYDAVSFMSVLHHAANHTIPLLKSAGRIARRYILLVEDTYVNNPAVEKALWVHDPHGIFRSDDEWKSLFAQHLPHFTLRSFGPIAMKSSMKAGLHASDVGADPSTKFYALERTAEAAACIPQQSSALELARK